MRVGFIGLGSMGRPMAQRILEDDTMELVVWARRPETLEPFVDTEATIVQSPAAMGSLADAVCICVFDASGVEEVIFGPNGLAETMKPGTAILIHSTVSPFEVQQLAANCIERGFRMLDAPVSGGQPKASIGELTVMVGGEASTLADASKVLETFSNHVVHLGAVGAGSQAKLINNTMFSAQIALADDAMIAGESLGIDPDGLADILRRSSSACVASGLRIRAGSMVGVLDSQAHLTLTKDVALMNDVIRHAPGSELVEAAQRFVAKIDEALAANVSSSPAQ